MIAYRVRTINFGSIVRAKKLFRLVGWLYTVKKLEAGSQSQVSCTYRLTVWAGMAMGGGS